MNLTARVVTTSTKNDFNPQDVEFGTLIRDWKLALPQDKPDFAKAIRNYAQRVYPKLNLYGILSVHDKALSLEQHAILKRNMAGEECGIVWDSVKVVKMKPKFVTAEA